LPLVTAADRTRAGRRVRLGLVLVLLLAVAALVVLIAVPRRPPPATLAPTPLLSRSELAGGETIARDGGYSAPLPAAPGRSLWLFGDTPVYVRHTGSGGRAGWALGRFITGSTAAVGSVATGASGPVPGPLSEVGTPAAGPAAAARRGTPGAGGAPAPFLAAPAGLVTADGLPCGFGGSYAASWISGVTRVPSTPDLLITFNDYCVLRGSGGFLHEGFGLAEYDPATQTLSDDVTVLAGAGLGTAASAAPFGSPVFSGGYLYLFAPTCTAPRSGRCAGTVVQARVPASPAAWADPFRYQWWAGGGPRPWTSDAAAAVSIIPGSKPSGVSVADFAASGRRFVLVEQTNIAGAFTVRESSSPGGPWNEVMTGRVPCRPGAGYANFCRAIIGHPEFSTRTQLVLSYFDPAAEAYGHVMLAGFRW
jgi:hypothetical protein